jgi:hypothetical protein
MRRKLLTLTAGIAAIFASSVNSNAQTLIHYWHFNNFTSAYTWPSIASIGADFSLIDTNKARVVYENYYPSVSASYPAKFDNVAGDVLNARMSMPAGNGIRTRNPTDSMQLLFYIPSTNYANLTLKFATQTSSYTSGDSVQLYAYSVDSGSTWITSGSGMSEFLDSASVLYRLVTVNFNDAAAFNNPKLVFRVTYLGRNNTGSGNNRFDNITLEGTTVDPTLHTSTMMFNDLGFTVSPNPALNVLNVNTNGSFEKSITITDVAGHQVYFAENENEHSMIDITNLIAGNYFVTVRDRNSGRTNTMKFSKQ